MDMINQNEEYIKMVGDALLKQTEKEIKPYDPKEHDKLMAQIRMARMLGVKIDLGR
jgi:prephenate dehydrogenase